MLPLLLLVLHAAPNAALLTRASRELACPVARLQVASSTRATESTPRSATVRGCGREGSFFQVRGAWLTLTEAVTVTDVSAVVDAFIDIEDQDDEHRVPRLDPEQVDAACYFPKMLMGLGYLQLRLAPDAAPAWLEKLAARVKPSPTPEASGFTSRCFAADAGSPRVVTAYVVAPRDDANHGSAAGVVVLADGAVLYWREWR